MKSRILVDCLFIVVCLFAIILSTFRLFKGQQYDYVQGKGQKISKAILVSSILLKKGIFY